MVLILVEDLRGIIFLVGYFGEGALNLKKNLAEVEITHVILSHTQFPLLLTRCLSVVHLLLLMDEY
jgi:hypothetical protein